MSAFLVEATAIQLLERLAIICKPQTITGEIELFEHRDSGSKAITQRAVLVLPTGMASLWSLVQGVLKGIESPPSKLEVQEAVQLCLLRIEDAITKNALKVPLTTLPDLEWEILLQTVTQTFPELKLPSSTPEVGSTIIGALAYLKMNDALSNPFAKPSKGGECSIL